MVVFNGVSQLWKKNEPDLSGLVPTFNELTGVRKYVPYLKDFKFNASSNKAGDYKSSFKGRGMEFEEVRAYAFGDDIRDIDWRVTARKNQPYTKLYAEEKDRVVYVWLDLSLNMRFGTKKELKSVSAAKTAALLGWFALSNKDRFGLIVYDGNKTHIFEPKRDYDNLLLVLKKMKKLAMILALALALCLTTSALAETVQDQALSFIQEAGIAADSSAPGFRRIIMAPKPDRRLGWIKAEYKSAAGPVKSAWRYEGDEWVWEFSVPSGATARVTLPGETCSREYAAGDHLIRHCLQK